MILNTSEDVIQSAAPSGFFFRVQIEHVFDNNEVE